MSTASLPRRFRTVVSAVCLSALCAGCGHSSHSVTFELRKVSLNLAFRDATKAPPLPPEQVVVNPAPVPTQGTFLSGLTPKVLGADVKPALPTFPHVVAPICATAPAGARPVDPATVSIATPVAAGTYTQYTDGDYNVTTPLGKLTGTMAPVSQMRITNVHDETTPGSEPLASDVRTITYDVTQPGLTTTTSTYRVTETSSLVGNTLNNVPTGSGKKTVVYEDHVDLVKVVWVTQGVTTSFTPEQPVMVMALGGVGASWNSTGVDHATGTAMTVQGTITAEEPVDVCGTLYDSYRVVSTERIVNAASQYVSTTDSSDPNVYNIATQLGGLMLRQHVNTTTNETVKNVPVTVAMKYTSTLSSVTPKP